jgi:hypothetical protein
MKVSDMFATNWLGSMKPVGCDRQNVILLLYSSLPEDQKTYMFGGCYVVPANVLNGSRTFT